MSNVLGRFASQAMRRSAIEAAKNAAGRSYSARDSSDALNGRGASAMDLAAVVAGYGGGFTLFYALLNGQNAQEKPADDIGAGQARGK